MKKICARILYWKSFTLLCLSALGAPVLFGGSDTHIWSVAPFVCAVWLAFACRLLAARLNNEAWTVPPAGKTLTVLFAVFAVAGVSASLIPYESRVAALFYASHLAAFFLWAGFAARPGLRKIALGLILLTAVGTSLYAIRQDATHISDRTAPQYEPHKVLWEDTLYSERANGTFRCPNHFAGWLALLIPFLTVLPFTRKAGLTLRLLALPALIAIAVALHMTQSRAGWLGALTALTALPCFLFLRRSRILFLLALILMPLLGAGAGYFAWKHSPAIQNRFVPVVNYFNTARAEMQKGATPAERKHAFIESLKTKNMPFRPQVWLDGWTMFKARPVFGHGLRTFEWTFIPYRDVFHRGWGERPMRPRFAHNEYVDLLGTAGMTGFILFAAGTGFVFFAFSRHLRRAPEGSDPALTAAALAMLSGTLVHAAFDFQWQLFAVPQMIAALGGIAVARTPQNPTPNRTGTTLTSIIAIGGLGLSLHYAIGGFLTYDGQKAARHDQAELATKRLIIAEKIDPQNWRAFHEHGLLEWELSRGSLDPQEKKRHAQNAIPLFGQSLQGNPVNARSLLYLSRALFAAGRDDEGFDALKKAAAIKEASNENYYMELAIAYRKHGRYTEALEAFKNARETRNSAVIRRNIEWLKKKIDEEQKPEN